MDSSTPRPSTPPDVPPGQDSTCDHCGEPVSHRPGTRFTDAGVEYAAPWVHTATLLHRCASGVDDPADPVVYLATPRPGLLTQIARALGSAVAGKATVEHAAFDGLKVPAAGGGVLHIPAGLYEEADAPEVVKQLTDAMRRPLICTCRLGRQGEDPACPVHGVALSMPGLRADSGESAVASPTGDQPNRADRANMQVAATSTSISAQHFHHDDDDNAADQLPCTEATCAPADPTHWTSGDLEPIVRRLFRHVTPVSWDLYATDTATGMGANLSIDSADAHGLIALVLSTLRGMLHDDVTASAVLGWVTDARPVIVGRRAQALTEFIVGRPQS